MNVFNLFLVWIFGFFVLLSFDLFTEAFIFEWLEWNGTNKNDWFFALWWGLVVVWALYGSLKIFLKWKDSHVLTNMQNEVYKVLTLKEWDQAQVSGLIITKLDKKDGFVHLSFLYQLNVTLSLYFAEEEEVALLQLDQSKVRDCLKYETPIPPGKRLGAFPHYYGELDASATSSVWQLKRNAFEVPIEILLQAEENTN